MQRATNRLDLPARDARAQGFTIAELMIVVAIVGAMAAIAVPASDPWLSSQRLRTSTRAVATALTFARSETVRTGNVHAVFFQQDTAAAPLIGPQGDTVSILVIDDGRPDVSNCLIGAGEAVLGVTLENGVSFGNADTTVKVATDSGLGAMATGSTFRDGGVGAARWVLFQPEGFPVGFNGACALGGIGTGAGGIYLNDGNKDSAIVLTPLGGRRTFSWNDLANQWSS